MYIHKEGLFILGSLLSILAVVNIFSYRFKRGRPFIIGASIILFLLVAQFFRNPTRDLTIDPNAVIAPCDGKVVIIDTVYEKEYLHRQSLHIAVFMSPINVHVNRNPVAGKLSYFKYHPGKYLFAWYPKSSELNERTTLACINQHNDTIVYRQIAGALARRIVWYVKPGDSIKQSDEFGFIKFGSRMDVYLPLNYKPLVHIDDKVSGGIDRLASF
jgi:phosphatidylserine decarboxylase